MVILNQFIPIGNKRFTSNRRKKHTSQCPFCKTKSKDIIFHYKVNHPRQIQQLQIGLSTGVIMELSSTRFVESTKIGA
jgi:hypothetical protein